MKVTVVGAGAVGASCAEYIAIKDFASEVVLLDIKEGYAEGKQWTLCKQLLLIVLIRKYQVVQMITLKLQVVIFVLLHLGFLENQE